ncbi:hypothetical protein BCV71DRAFT_251968 [Rhizopus microsporus]|uniref:Uncharacterized protein n=1 Tax=Rhizopus microsporus TaxID=58291 RepID=A0A1X0RM15_RHIZD|nr:hypothetical protein BCV71DRAFT_251968 [Rhizopus microsporus]
MFPKISLAKMCLHRLGVLDPAIQQGALQMHWLIPFVKSAPNGPLSVFWFSRGMRSSIVIPRLADYLLWHLKTLAATTPVTWPIEDYRLAFLFKDLRPPSLRSLNSAFTLLFRAVDLLPPSYELTVPNGRTCLELPVSVVLRATPRFTLHRSLACVRLSSTYVVDTTTGCLRAKINSELDVSPILARKFLRLVKHDDILLSNFLIRPFIPPQYATNITDPFEANVSHGVDAYPFLESLSLIQKEYAHPFNSKGFRVFCARDSQLHPSSTRLRPRCWTRFWDISLPHSGHNVCEPMDHFLFLCPEKFDQHTFIVDHVRSALHQLQFPRLDSFSPMLDPEVIFGLASLGIWRSHWLFVFNDIPFVASPVTKNICRSISVAVQENCVKQGQAHRALLFFSID